MSLTIENLLERLGRMSASSFFSLKSGSKIRNKVILRIARERTEKKQEESRPSSAMRYGSANEAAALVEVQKTIKNVWGNNNFYPIDFKSSEGVVCLVGATPDALYGDGEPLEIKSPASKGNYEEQIAIVDEIIADMDGDFRKYEFGKQIQGNLWQLAFQVWVMREWVKLHEGASDLKHGTIVFSAPGNEEQKIFRPEFSEDVFAAIEAAVVRAERDIQAACSGEVIEAGDDNEMTVESAATEMSEIKGFVNCVDEVAKRMKRQVDTRRETLINRAKPHIDRCMEFLKDNVEMEHILEGSDKRISGLTMKASQTIEIEDWRAVPEGMLKITLDKTKANKYLKEKGVPPPGTQIKTGEKVVSVRAVAMAHLVVEDFKYLTGPHAFLEGDEGYQDADE